MPEDLPILNDTAHLMLAAFGERSNLADFQVAVQMRPEFEYDEAGCLAGLETLTSVGALEKLPVEEGGEQLWQITPLGDQLLRVDRSKQFGPPEAVTLEPQPAVLASDAEVQT